MNTHPEKWYIGVTRENRDELDRWRKKVATSHRSGALKAGYTLLSKHHLDNSYYYASHVQVVRRIDDYKDYQEITLEQFRQITSPKNMTALPTNWYIGVTEENQEELDRWRQQVATEYRDYPLKAGHTLLSRHQYDGSYFYSDNAREVRDHEDYADYQEITLEQFRQITNPKNMTALPTNWYIEVTRENRDELDRWRKKVANSHRNETLKTGYTLLSRHQYDGSYYYSNNATAVRKDGNYADYQEITLEQFRQITNQTPKPMTKSIQISRDLLNEYYEASTREQKAYLSENFKLDGTTTDEAIRGLHEMACNTWKPRIKKNHPECFPEDSKHFDFSAYVSKRGNCGVIEHDVAELLGLSSDFIQIMRSGEDYRNRSFYLDNDYEWELIKDGASNILIPTKK